MFHIQIRTTYDILPHPLVGSQLTVVDTLISGESILNPVEMIVTIQQLG